jgi:uncharacterized protein
MDLDLTDACNLACHYCYKWQKKAVHMEEAVAKAAIDWLLEASGELREPLKINLMGGEPTLRFELIKKIVPYGKSRARQVGKNMHFGCTTNCTRLTDEMLEFWRGYGMGFHCSIDGIPEVQNANRPFLGGSPSSPLIERNVRKILAYRPSVTARATITPASASVLRESALYLESLGFRAMTFRVAVNCRWTERDFATARQEYAKLAGLYVDRLVENKPLDIQEFREGLQALHAPRRAYKRPCGAGCGIVMIDARGDIWPCHRFGPHLAGGQFRLGKLGESFNDRLREVFQSYDVFEEGRKSCDGCPAAQICRRWCYVECASCTGSIYTPSETYCTFIKIIYEQVIRINDCLKYRHGNLLSTLLK